MTGRETSVTFRPMKERLSPDRAQVLRSCPKSGLPTSLLPGAKFILNIGAGPKIVWHPSEPGGARLLPPSRRFLAWPSFWSLFRGQSP